MTAAGTYELLTDRGPAAIAIVRLTGRGVAGFVSRHVQWMHAMGGAGAALEVDAVPKSTAEAELGRYEGGLPRSGAFRRARLIDEGGRAVDEIIVSVHKGGPEQDVWLHLHGGRGVVDACMALIERARFTSATEEINGSATGEDQTGGFAAETDEADGFTAAVDGPDGFAAAICRTSRIWSARNGVEAEVVRLLPRMTTLTGAGWLLHQAQILPAAIRDLIETSQRTAANDCRAMLERSKIFDWFAKPVRIALIGPPNAGKSTLLNAVAGRPAALVSDVAGTTRDWVEAAGEIGGFPALWIDTAGLREATSDPIEEAGMRRSVEVCGTAEVVVVVLDGTKGREAAERFVFDVNVRMAEGGRTPVICAAVNKSDVCGEARFKETGGLACCAISALTGAGLDGLYALILSALGRADADLDAPAAVGDRIAGAIRSALDVNNFSGLPKWI